MTLVLWRHGQTDYNLEGRIQGRVDIPLNDIGRDQAASAAPDLVALNPAAIFSSPLERARQTAEVLASAIGLGVHVDNRLAERSFGRWEGLSRAQIEERWPEQFDVWRSGGRSGRGWELRPAAMPLFEWEQRCGRSLRRWVAPRLSLHTGRPSLWGRPIFWGLTPPRGSGCMVWATAVMRC